MKKSMIAAAVVATAPWPASGECDVLQHRRCWFDRAAGQLGDFTLSDRHGRHRHEPAGGTDITTAGSGVRSLDATAVSDITTMVNAAARCGRVGHHVRPTSV